MRIIDADSNSMTIQTKPSKLSRKLGVKPQKRTYKVHNNIWSIEGKSLGKSKYLDNLKAQYHIDLKEMLAAFWATF